MRLSRQSQSFFYENILSVKKHSRAKIKQQNKIKHILNNKATFFMRAKTSQGVKVVCFAFCCYFYAESLLVRNRLEIVLITSLS